VVFRDGEILAYEKGSSRPDMRHIDYGLGVMSSRVLLGYPASEPFDLARVYQDQLRDGQLTGFEVHTRFYEIGSPQGLEDTRRFLASRASSPRHP
jgi:NDP-sugar pyrophosphorylase family protein